MQNFLTKILPAAQVFFSLFLSSTVSETDSHSQHVSRNRLVLPPSQVRKGFSPVVSESCNILWVDCRWMWLDCHSGGLAPLRSMPKSYHPLQFLYFYQLRLCWKASSSVWVGSQSNQTCHVWEDWTTTMKRALQEMATWKDTFMSLICNTKYFFFFYFLSLAASALTRLVSSASTTSTSAVSASASTPTILASTRYIHRQYLCCFTHCLLYWHTSFPTLLLYSSVKTLIGCERSSFW